MKLFIVLASMIFSASAMAASSTVTHGYSQVLGSIKLNNEQTVDERHLNSLTMKFNRDKNAEAKTFILNFVKEFNDRFYDNHSSDIHQLNVQFFEHTNKKESEGKESIV